MGCNKSSSKKEVYSYTSLPRETRKISNKQPNLILKRTRKRRTKPQIVEGSLENSQIYGNYMTHS